MIKLIQVFCLALVFSCSRSYDLGDKTADSVTVNTTSPTWDNGISNVIQTKCVTCHTPASSRSKFVPGNTPSTLDGMNSESFYADSAKATVIQNRVFVDTTTPMPPKFATPLSDNEKIALAAWLNTKVVNVATICGSTGSSAWSYTEASTVIASDCASCHNGTSQVAFDTKAKVQTYRASMLQYLNQGKMPPTTTVYKTAGNGALLFNWLCFGGDSHQG